MENSGNEAKEWLKTKDITFLSGAYFAHFAHQLTQIWLQNEHKLHKRSEAYGLQREAEAVTRSRLRNLWTSIDGSPSADWGSAHLHGGRIVEYH